MVYFFKHLNISQISDENEILLKTTFANQCTWERNHLLLVNKGQPVIIVIQYLLKGIYFGGVIL